MVMVKDDPDPDGRYFFQFFYPGAMECAYSGYSERNEDAVHDCLTLVAGRPDPVVIALLHD